MSRLNPPTTSTLLESLKDSKKDAVWREFDARFRPVITALAQRAGMSAADAEEIAQESLAEFVAAYREGKYDRSKGHLSSWMIGIARNRMAMRWRSKGRAKVKRGESAMGEAPNRTRLTRIWTAEQERAIFERAWDMLRATGKTAENTLKAFELVAMRGIPPEAAAEQCGMTVEEVYVARTRVTKRLRDIADKLTRAYEHERG